MSDTFDFVVVGGGSGGCAVAGRLTEDNKTTVALLDAGGKNDNWVVTTPGAIILMLSFTVGEAFIVALAARQELPEELYAVARLEGAKPWYVLRTVTLPLMAPVLLLLAARDVAVSLQATFTATYLLTDGGPDRATLLLPIYSFDMGFELLRYGYASAMMLLGFLGCLALALLQYRFIRRWRLAL